MSELTIFSSTNVSISVLTLFYLHSKKHHIITSKPRITALTVIYMILGRIVIIFQIKNLKGQTKYKIASAI